MTTRLEAGEYFFPATINNTKTYRVKRARLKNGWNLFVNEILMGKFKTKAEAIEMACSIFGLQK